MRSVRSKNLFCLMKIKSTLKIRILDASLVRRVKISPVLLAHAQMLSKITAKYPLRRVEVKTFMIQTGLVWKSLMWYSEMKRIIVGFIDNKAFNDDKKLNPFNFKNYGINFFLLYADGMYQISNRPLQSNFSRDKLFYIKVYHIFFLGTGIHFLNEGNFINRDDYSRGFLFFAFDFTPDLSANCTVRH